jgi:hypothetical protein
MSQWRECYVFNASFHLPEQMRRHVLVSVAVTYNGQIHDNRKVSRKTKGGPEFMFVLSYPYARRSKTLLSLSFCFRKLTSWLFFFLKWFSLLYQHSLSYPDNSIPTALSCFGDYKTLCQLGSLLIFLPCSKLLLTLESPLCSYSTVLKFCLNGWILALVNEKAGRGVSMVRKRST